MERTFELDQIRIVLILFDACDRRINMPGPPSQPCLSHNSKPIEYLLSGAVKYRYGSKVVELRQGDLLLFDATALHGIEEIGDQAVSYLSLVFTLRE